jgi:hypothetical protein
VTDHDPEGVPPFVREFVRQLLDPDLLAVLRAAGAGQVDVTLSASNGKVRARPTVTLNAGPQRMVAPT